MNNRNRLLGLTVVGLLGATLATAGSALADYSYVTAPDAGAGGWIAALVAAALVMLNFVAHRDGVATVSARKSLQVSRKGNARMALAAALVFSTTAMAAFEPYVIRGAPVIQVNNTYVPGATEFIIAASGQKAGLGSSAIDGSTLGSITNLAIDRLDDRTRFTAGSGPAVAPYLNFWITDGLGNFAVVANEPSDGAFQPLYSAGYHLSFADLANKVAKIYENSDKTWLPNNGVGLTFADLANFVVKAPSVAELDAGWAGLGTGAPRELGTNEAWGVNWVFGDTLANYVSAPSAEGYVVANASVFSPSPTEAHFIITPADVGGAANNLIGIAGDAAPDFEGGSFAGAAMVAGAKSEIYFDPMALFGRAIRVGDVASMSYWTKTGATHTVDPRDWFLAIYTQPFAGDASSPGWYGARFGAEPYFSNNLTDPANTWNEWTTGGANNQLRFFESTAGAPGANFGTYLDPDWGTFLVGNSLGTSVQRRNQQVHLFSIQTGSSWANGFTGQLDGLTIELGDGSIATINFAADLNSVKLAVLADLQALLPSLSKPRSDKVKSAIGHLIKSLNPKFWVDGSHLTRDGKTVFDEEKKAVHDLENVSPPLAVTTSAINALVADDRALATIAIAESTKRAADIAKAQQEIAKGDADSAIGKFEEAIGHYKNAWDLAT